jgi:ABC-type amino acid transport substrate-binding protein
MVLQHGFQPFYRALTAIAALAGCVLSMALPASTRAETLVVMGDHTYAPVIYQDNGQPAGVLVDILRKVSERTGDVYDVQLFPWNRAYDAALRGQGAVVGLSMNIERQSLFDFSDPLYNDDIQIVVRRGHEFPFTKLTDLKGKILGGVLGASYGEEVDRAIRDGLFKMDRDVGQAGRLHKLLAGRMDAALIGNGQAGLEAVLASDPLLLAQRNQFVVLKSPLARDPLYLAAAKGMDKQALIARFNKALRELQKSGTLKKLPGDSNPKK